MEVSKDNHKFVLTNVPNVVAKCEMHRMFFANLLFVVTFRQSKHEHQAPFQPLILICDYCDHSCY